MLARRAWGHRLWYLESWRAVHRREEQAQEDLQILGRVLSEEGQVEEGGEKGTEEKVIEADAQANGSARADSNKLTTEDLLGNQRYQRLTGVLHNKKERLLVVPPRSLAATGRQGMW